MTPDETSIHTMINRLLSEPTKDNMLNVLIILALSACTTAEEERVQRGVQLAHKIYQVHPEGRSDVTCFILDVNPSGGMAPSMSCVARQLTSRVVE